jgi:hypothetical protein
MDGLNVLRELGEKSYPALEIRAYPLLSDRSFNIPLAADRINLDLPHRLHILVNPTGVLPETDLGNNRIQAAIGGLPAPQGVLASARQGGSLVFLNWTAVSDPRVAGYRIYRGLAGSPLFPVGSTFTNHWVDLTAALDRTYHYAVASYSNEGIESGFTGLYPASLVSYRSMLPLVVLSR